MSKKSVYHSYTPEYQRQIDDLRARAFIRRKDTCRGPEDRLANQLEAAADSIEDLTIFVEHMQEYLRNDK